MLPQPTTSRKAPNVSVRLLPLEDKDLMIFGFYPTGNDFYHYFMEEKERMGSTWSEAGNPSEVTGIAGSQ